MKPIIIVHGGAGDVPQCDVIGKLTGVQAAARKGYEVLMNGRSALDAVEAAIVSMENDVNLNAGYGSVLNVRGEVEMDASIMCGTNLDVGAVTLVRDFAHPISIARRVLTDSPHSFFGGEGVKIFALEKGFEAIPPNSLVCDSSKEALEDFLKHGVFGTAEVVFKDEAGGGTVGAVALDVDGHVAAATSSGGLTGKAVGRIGDTSQIGSGTYADDNIGGVSATGHGESVSKHCLAHNIIKLMEFGTRADVSTTKVVNCVTRRLNKIAGAITISKHGDIGLHFTSKTMPWTYVKNETVYYGIKKEDFFHEPY